MGMKVWVFGLFKFALATFSLYTIKRYGKFWASKEKVKFSHNTF